MLTSNNKNFKFLFAIEAEALTFLLFTNLVQWVKTEKLERLPLLTILLAGKAAGYFPPGNWESCAKFYLKSNNILDEK